MIKKNRKPYKFQNVKHSVDGFVSIGLEILSIFLLFTEIVMTIYERGQAGGMVGYLGFAALLLAIMGLIFAIVSWQDEEAHDTSKRIGTMMGIGVVIANAVLFLLGIAGR